MSSCTSSAGSHMQANDFETPEGCKILFVSPVSFEALSVLGIPPQEYSFASALGVQPSYFEVSTPVLDTLPNPENYHGVFIAGSTNSVYDNAPWIPDLKRFTRHCIESGIPLFGSCFGHQIIADVLGGLVEPAYKRETGIADVCITPEGREDPLFEGVETTFHCATSHGDVVTRLPSSATEIAVHPRHRNYGLAVGSTVRSLQSHAEMSSDVLTKIMRSRKYSLRQGDIVPDCEEAFEEHIEQIQGIDLQQARTIIRNFFLYYILPYFQRA